MKMLQSVATLLTWQLEGFGLPLIEALWKDEISIGAVFHDVANPHVSVHIA